MAKERTYYTLAFLSTNLLTNVQTWGPEFGDYDKDTVQAELDDYIEGGANRKHFKIVKSGDSQASVNAAIAKLNVK